MLGPLLALWVWKLAARRRQDFHDGMAQEVDGGGAVVRRENDRELADILVSADEGEGLVLDSSQFKQKRRRWPWCGGA